MSHELLKVGHTQMEKTNKRTDREN